VCTLSSPQRVRLSDLNTCTHFTRRVQFIATCLGIGGSASGDIAGRLGAPMRVRTGVTAARDLLCGANTPLMFTASFEDELPSIR
jgi:hypothetical protein